MCGIGVWLELEDIRTLPEWACVANGNFTTQASVGVAGPSYAAARVWSGGLEFTAEGLCLMNAPETMSDLSDASCGAVGHGRAA